jgi:hypothetical protein
MVDLRILAKIVCSMVALIELIVMMDYFIRSREYEFGTDVGGLVYSSELVYLCFNLLIMATCMFLIFSNNKMLIFGSFLFQIFLIGLGVFA